MNKAKRLILDGQVNVVRNTPTIVTGIVEGDHGTYHSAISRHDPNSQAIEQWVCDCPWHQFAFMRTRQWKKLEGRVCSHVMALYMQARSTPLDTEGMEDHKPGKGQKVNPVGPGQLQMPFDQQADDQKTREEGLTREQVLEMQKQQQEENPIPGDKLNEPQESLRGPEIQPDMPAPIQEDAIPQGPPVPPPPPNINMPVNPPTQTPGPNPFYEQMSLWDATVPNSGGPGLPPTNPVSIPGGRPNSPLNPLDQLGVPGMGINTLSKVASIIISERTDFSWHIAKDPFEEWGSSLLSRGYTPRVMFTNPVHLEARGGKIPVPGAIPTGFTNEGIPQYRTLDLGWNPQLQRRMNANEGGPHGPGAPEMRGQFIQVKPGMHAELRAVEPTLKSAYVAVHLPGSGPLHPHQLEGWVDYKDVAAHPNQTSPFSPNR